MLVVRLEGREAAEAVAVEAQDLKVWQREEPAGHAAAQRVPRQVHKGQRPVQRARFEARSKEIREALAANRKHRDRSRPDADKMPR